MYRLVSDCYFVFICSSGKRRCCAKESTSFGLCRLLKGSIKRVVRICDDVRMANSKQYIYYAIKFFQLINTAQNVWSPIYNTKTPL